MPQQDNIDKLKREVDRLGEFNGEKLEKVIRKNLGEASLEKELQPRLDEIKRISQFALRYASIASNEAVSNLSGGVNTCVTRLAEQAGRPDADYIAQKVGFLGGVDEGLDACRRYLPAFVSGALLEKNLLGNEEIEQKFRDTIEQLQNEVNLAQTKIKGEADRIIQTANEIKAGAVRTATGISVAEAQKQFKEAADDLSKKIRMWGKLVVFSLISLGVTPLLFHWLWPLSPLPADQWPVSLYHTLLRLLVLSTVAGASAFCIKIFRAHLHMAEKNKHRVRVANSFESFVNSVNDPQQRELVVVKLVEAIIEFGDSGLIKHEQDDMGSSGLSGEWVGRILAALNRKP